MLSNLHLPGHTPQDLQSQPGSGADEQLPQVRLQPYLAHLPLIPWWWVCKEENQEQRSLRASLALVSQ